jgi:hypothetical protein
MRYEIQMDLLGTLLTVLGLLLFANVLILVTLHIRIRQRERTGTRNRQPGPRVAGEVARGPFGGRFQRRPRGEVVDLTPRSRGSV